MTVAQERGYSTNDNVKYPLGCLPFVMLIVAIPILISCHTSRNIQTTHVAIDSAVTHVRDSMSQVNRSIEQRYQQRIQELVNSSVVFETQPCPNEQQLLSLLDSIGKINYRNMVNGNQQDIGGGSTGIAHPAPEWGNSNGLTTGVNNTAVGSVTFGHVVIGSNGSIDATGRIKSVTVSNGKLKEENYSLLSTVDSLGHVIDSQKIALNKKVDEKVKIVERTYIPWWMWCIAGLGFVLWFYKLIPKRPKLPIIIGLLLMSTICFGQPIKPKQYLIIDTVRWGQMIEGKFKTLTLTDKEMPLDGDIRIDTAEKKLYVFIKGKFVELKKGAV